MYKFSQSLQSSRSKGRPTKPAVQLRERAPVPPPAKGVDLIEDIFGPCVSPTVSSPSPRPLPLRVEPPVDSHEYDKKKQKLLKLLADPEVVEALCKVFAAASAD